MIRRYLWHIVFALFVIISLANIFQKLKWNASTDGLVWQGSERGLVCVQAPENNPIKVGDILITVNKYTVNSKIDLLRSWGGRNYCRYEIEREGLLKNVGVDINITYTPLSYYILVSVGILFILLTLGVLNIQLRSQTYFQTPAVFYLMALSFSGFLIFSPTGDYHLMDFVYLILDNVSYLFFPAFLLHFSLYFPQRTKILRKSSTTLPTLLIYLVPSALLVFNIYFIIENIFRAIPESLSTVINYFRNLSTKYFLFYLALAYILLLASNLNLIIVKKNKRYLFPLSGLTAGTAILVVFNILPAAAAAKTGILPSLSLLVLMFMPLSLVYLLAHRRFSDIENTIRKTLSISSVFIFIFGAYLFLGLNIEQNKLLGIFWSIAAILMAGLLFKPMEATIQKYFEKIFYRDAFNFKRKLKELEHSISSQRDPLSLSRNFLEIINRGFQLQSSSLIIHFHDNTFLSLPVKRKMVLSTPFQNRLLTHRNLVFLSSQEFEKKYHQDYQVFKDHHLFQFLPLTIGDKLIGLAAMGRKDDNTYLTIEDWDLLYGISASLALSLENAFLYSRLESQLNELHLLKEFNENIIENINLGIVVLNYQNIIKTWNGFMEAKFKIDRQQALNCKASAVLAESLWKKIQKVKSGVGAIPNFPVVIQEENAIYDIYLSPLKNISGKISGKIVVFEDVTEKTNIQNQLIRSEKMASIGVLSAGIAHEINTPLTGISSYCQFILNNPEDHENRDLIVKIQDQVIRANRIIRSLLDFSRQKGEHLVEINLKRLIEESLALIEHQLKNKSITIKMDLTITRPIFGFPTRLQQLFINLLINAIDAVAPDSGQISLQAQEDLDHILVRIKDNGKGIAEEHLDRIFDPFFTTKEIGMGTGLGLSIVYTIVK